MIFTIDSENNVTAHASKKDAATVENAQQFDSQKELAKLGADWPGDRLVEIWNSLPGGTPVKKFTNRTIALGRIWKAIQSLGADAPPHAPTKALTKTKKATREAKPMARDGSKKAQVIEMLRRPDGSTLAAIMKATDWQAHTVRGFISGALVKKAGMKVESLKRENGERAYSIRG